MHSKDQLEVIQVHTCKTMQATTGTQPVTCNAYKPSLISLILCADLTVITLSLPFLINLQKCLRTPQIKQTLKTEVTFTIGKDPFYFIINTYYDLDRRLNRLHFLKQSSLNLTITVRSVNELYKQLPQKSTKWQ